MLIITQDGAMMTADIIEILQLPILVFTYEVRFITQITYKDMGNNS